MYVVYYYKLFSHVRPSRKIEENMKRGLCKFCMTVMETQTECDTYCLLPRVYIAKKKYTLIEIGKMSKVKIIQDNSRF